MKLDSISEARLDEVHPALADKIRQMQEILALDNPPITIRVTQGLRSWIEQANLYAQGRTRLGPKVTNALPGHSFHQFGLAVDIVPLSDVGPDWNEQHPCWQRLVQVGVHLGLVAGAQFRTFPDYPHFQLTGSLPTSPTDEVRQAFQDGGLGAVWLQTGLTTMA